MANLIEYIQSQVYENSTEDISGSIMQQVLTRMASDEGVVNVHTISGQTPFADYNNAQAARDAVPAGFKKLGLIITYKLSSGWYIDEFIGSATSGWSTASNWKCLGPISVSQNASTGKTTITIGSESFDVATQPVSVSQNSLTIGGDYKGELSTTYDVTLHNDGATFASLGALLSDANLSTLIPLAVRKGGMSIKFVQSSDNNYVQYRLIANSFTTDITKWQNYDVLDSAISDILDLQEESITPTVYASGKYVDWDLHKLMTLSSYSVSNPIKLNVGDKIKVHSAANSSISIISLCDESMTEFSCLVQGPTNQTFVDSEYQATKDCYVCLSWLTDAGITAKIFYSATISYLSEQNQKAVGNNKIDVTVEAAIEGKYVDWDAQKIMAYSAYNVSKPIRLFKGDVITGRCAGNNAISLLSLCDKCLVHFTRLIQGPDPQTYKTFTYTATEDCYVCLSYLAEADVSFSIESNVSLEVLRNSIANIDIENKDKNPLYGKVVTFEGDSICAGLGSSEGIYGEGWASRIGIDNDMNWRNQSISGSTIESIADRIQYYESISHRKVDYFIFEGGTNDADTMGAANLGELSPLNSFDGNYGTTTFYERMERLIKMIITYNPNAKIGYIVAPKMGAGSAYNNRRLFFDAAINSCKKWGIPYLDLWSENPMNPNLQVYWDGVDHETATAATQAGCYYIDGQHLSQLGYDYIYTQIEEWMKTL